MKTTLKHEILRVKRMNEGGINHFSHQNTIIDTTDTTSHIKSFIGYIDVLYISYTLHYITFYFLSLKVVFVIAKITFFGCAMQAALRRHFVISFLRPVALIVTRVS